MPSSWTSADQRRLDASLPRYAAKRKPIKRVPPPKDVHAAWLRMRTATLLVTELKKIAQRSNQFPQTKAAIRRAIKSAEGAERHAQGVHARLQSEATR